jgi:hypothetical protein
VGSPAGGGAHLVGSLADLPYVLAQMEQDFIAPENVQALIWSDLVPGVLTNAILPRWWGVSRDELHAVALYQLVGEALLTASAGNEELRSKVMNIFSDRMIPQRLAWLEEALREGRLAEVSAQVTPSDTFYLTAEFRRRFQGEINSWGPAGQELESLSREHPELNWERLSRDFGVPHPILARTYARELLNVKPFPMFEGYSSRLLAPLGRRDGLSPRDAKPSGPRAHWSHGREDFCHRPKRLAGDTSCNARGRRRVSAGKGCLRAHERRYSSRP